MGLKKISYIFTFAVLSFTLSSFVMTNAYADPAYVTTIGETGVTGSDNDHLSYPDGIAVDSADNIYVADIFNYRIQIFNAAGLWQSTIGETGV
ncbi:NHL repeat protein, partial [Candidatus Nitrosarchaeum limnium BG20]